MDAKLEKIWMDTIDPEFKQIRVDWDNDRHQCVDIKYPFGPKETLNAIELLWNTVSGEYLSGNLKKQSEMEKICRIQWK